ncbi:MAG: tetratricopeptide repeat protein [Flavobacteriaceae bacterium]|nr:tetratricopeptide repeat protein [Flavobacteriaceae bacterium]
MNTKAVVLTLFFIMIVSSCSKNIDYSAEFIKQTSGRYLFNQDAVIDVFYDNNTLFLKWKGAEKIKPIVLDSNTFFVADLYKKLQFVQHPKTKAWYLSEISNNHENTISYDYLKVADSFKTPSMYLKDKEYNKALLGYLDIQKQDSTSVFINESDFNRLGYDFLRENKYQDAIHVFKINVALYPESDNVYDSLADAYVRSGDSLQAFVNYSKALEYNSGNQRAKNYVELYNKKSK